MAYKIMLDAGHGGFEPGAIYNGRQEKDDNLKLTLDVGERLKAYGYDVVYTRTTDVYETPFAKATEANESGADLFISIHRNSFPVDNEVKGVESLVYDKSGIKLEIAEAIDQELVELGFVDLGVKARPNLVVLNKTEMPAVLVEAGFINSEEDNRLFDEKFEEIAQGIADGIYKVVGASGNYDMGKYYVQVGLFRVKKYAERLVANLLNNRYPAMLEYDERGYYVVKVGNYNNLLSAINMEQRLKRDGYETIIMTS